MWSYSRINSFGECPYGWFLKYIKCLPPVSNFYAEYGKFMHHILQRYFQNTLNRSELTGYYLSNFTLQVKQKPHKGSIYADYFRDGLRYLSEISWPESQKIGVERRVSFKIGPYKALGFIDLVEREDGIVITDHKSAKLKPRSARIKPTKEDIALDGMFRQLYLYALAIKQAYGEYPTRLRFNSFRTGSMIEEPFDEEKLNETVKWAENEIETITYNEEWKPKIDYFRCNYLCDMRENCEYYMMNRGD